MKKNKIISIGVILVFSISCALFFVYSKNKEIEEEKRIDTLLENFSIKLLAQKYYKFVSTEDIEIINSFEEKGKKVFILKIEDEVCEMPTLKIEDTWRATGITCQR